MFNTFQNKDITVAQIDYLLVDSIKYINSDTSSENSLGFFIDLHNHIDRIGIVVQCSNDVSQLNSIFLTLSKIEQQGRRKDILPTVLERILRLTTSVKTRLLYLKSSN